MIFIVSRERQQIERIENELANLNQEYEHMFNGINSQNDETSTQNGNDIRLKSLLNQFDQKASELMQLKHDHHDLANRYLVR